MSGIFKNLKQIILTCSIATAIILSYNVGISSAEYDLEQEFLSITKNYEDEDIVVENGISLRFGEELDLSNSIKWKVWNDSIVEISDNGILRPLSEGTTYLSKEVDGKIHIMEVYVPITTPKSLSYKKSTTADRNYYKVFVDAGHGGSDNGASGNGYFEDDLNLQVAKRVEEKLKKKGIDVMMSRTSDVYLSLSKRASLANDYDADVFVSIHQNSADVASANGIETYHHKDKISHKELSNNIQTSAIYETGARDRGVKSAKFAVLRETIMPASLFESGFISNKNESLNLSSSSYQDKIATGIANGIEKYLSENIQINGGSSDEPNILPVIDTGVVNTDGLNVRTGPSVSYAIIGVLSINDKVEIVDTQNNWYKIKYKNQYGYVSSRYVDIDVEDGDNENIGWQLINGAWYYFDEEGKKVTGWLDLNGTWYYLKPSGAMVTGWLDLNGTWYYLKPSGAMAKGWLDLNGTWYYLKPSGAMAKGWLKLNGSKFYLENSGRMVTGWKSISGKWYYFYSNGNMAMNTVIDGWKISSTGVATKVK